jgi:hypothetical protein
MSSFASRINGYLCEYWVAFRALIEMLSSFRTEVPESQAQFQGPKSYTASNFRKSMLVSRTFVQFLLSSEKSIYSLGYDLLYNMAFALNPLTGPRRKIIYEKMGRSFKYYNVSISKSFDPPRQQSKCGKSDLHPRDR